MSQFTKQATRHVLKSYLNPLLMGVAALCCVNAAQAAVTCTSLSAPTLNFSYIGGTNSSLARNVMSGVITAVCTRTVAADTAVAVGAGNGNNAGGGGIGKALLTAAGTDYFINYNLYRVNSSCSTTFGNAGSPNSRISANFIGTVGQPETLTFNFWGCVSGQGSTNIETAGYPAGLYTDSAAITIRPVTGTVVGGLLPISSAVAINIIAPAKCTISGGPADINFNYTAFGAANFQSSAFTANCTNLMPYTIALSPTNGVVGGLKYQLGLTATTPGSASNIGPTSLTNVGGATGKLHYVNGVMDAGQAGQSGSPLVRPHTLTITY